MFLQIELVVNYGEQKNLNCGKWNPSCKKWSSNEETDANKYGRINLAKTTYDDKEFIKEHGGKWDANNKCWYTYNSNKSLTEKFHFYDYIQIYGMTDGKTDEEPHAPGTIYEYDA